MPHGISYDCIMNFWLTEKDVTILKEILIKLIPNNCKTKQTLIIILTRGATKHARS